MKKISLLSLALMIGSFHLFGQKPTKMETLLASKQKWTVLDIKSRQPYFELGENFTIRIDGSFYHDRNNYAKLGGDWTLDGKNLILTYDSFTEERRRIPYIYKIKKWGRDGIQLIYRNRFNRKEKVYLR